MEGWRQGGTQEWKDVGQMRDMRENMGWKEGMKCHNSSYFMNGLWKEKEGRREGRRKREEVRMEKFRGSHNSSHVIVVDGWMDGDMDGCKEKGNKGRMRK